MSDVGVVKETYNKCKDMDVEETMELASDEDVLDISKRLLAQNKEAYEMLAQ